LAILIKSYNFWFLWFSYIYKTFKLSFLLFELLSVSFDILFHFIAMVLILEFLFTSFV
jgi:hypothetical protein